MIILAAAAHRRHRAGCCGEVFDRPGELTTREGFAAVGLAWTAMCLLGTLPYLFTGSIGNITDAVFESGAGFTTTGASMIPDPASAARTASSSGAR